MRFTIYQKPSILNHFTIKEDRSTLQEELTKYVPVWTGETENKKEALADIFRTFNINHPINYAGRSLSVGDIVQIGKHYFICDMAGWQEIK